MPLTQFIIHIIKTTFLVTGLVTLTIVAQAAEPEKLAFVGYWDAQTAERAPSVWRYVHAAAPNRISAAPDPSFRQPDTSVATITVRPGDKVGGWTGERAEVAVMQNTLGAPLNITAASGRQVLAVSIKLPADWQPPVATAVDQTAWGIFLQLHGPDALGASPAIALQAREDFHINLATGDLFKSGRQSWGNSHAFSHGSLNKGQWVEFILDIVWAADTAGSITVHRRDQGQTGWTQVFQALNTPTLQYKTGQAVGPHYWKTGYYRNAGLGFTSQLQLGPVAVGNSFAQIAAWADR